MSNATQVVTGACRLSYEHLFTPWKGADGDRDPRYEVVLMIPKSDKATLAAIKKAIQAAIQEGLPKWGGSQPKGLKMPIRDGDEADDNPEYAGYYTLSVSSTRKPSVVDQNVQPILDATEIYSGCWARAAIVAWPYNNSGNKGVTFFVNHVQKIRDGEPFGNITRAEDVFDSVEGESTVADDDDDILGLL